jgi:hypothetical protein
MHHAPPTLFIWSVLTTVLVALFVSGLVRGRISSRVGYIRRDKQPINFFVTLILFAAGMVFGLHEILRNWTAVFGK